MVCFAAGCSLLKSKLKCVKLNGVACHIASSFSEYSLYDYCLLSIAIDCYRFLLIDSNR